MPDGETATVPDALSSVTLEGNREGASFMDNSKSEKDPRKIARKYQLELCKRALEENVIVYLGTGCGKTHIAILVMYELRHLIKVPQKCVCIFLAPTVALVNQQAEVIEESVDFKVGRHCGNNKHLKSHSDWEREIEEHEILVMTPQILLRNLSHSFITMESIALLIFDECHHAQIKSDHPYAEIMKVFYKAHDGKRPRIFGMTASPVVGKGASSQENLPKCINSLETLLDAKIYSVEDKEELESFVASPVVKVYQYTPAATGTSSFFAAYFSNLEAIKRKWISEVRKQATGRESLQRVRGTNKLLNKMHDNIMFCLEHLGLWGASQACQSLLRDDHSEWYELVGAEGSSSDESICNRYLAQAADFLAAQCRDGGASDLSFVEVLKEPFFSAKLLRLIGILNSFRLRPHMKCIVFVNRIIIARSLSYILQNLKLLTSWKSDFLVGVHSGLKAMSRKSMNNILDGFRSGKLNLLVATKVGEEGLDIQTCCLVIRFDLPETVASFIQSRGRARMANSEYIFLVNSSNPKELDLIENFRKNEDRMNVEVSVRTSKETFVCPEGRVFEVNSSGATITSGYSISLLHHYCSKLPHDEFFDPKPSFHFFDDLGGTICHIILPSNAPLHEVTGTPQSSMDAAKKDACLNAIEKLHELGALNNFLLPEQVVTDDTEETASCSSDSCEDEDSRGELCEMLVPSVLKRSWNNLETPIFLYSYYLEFCPLPSDRMYKQFGLFMKAPLPPEAEKAEIDLHLDRRRSVITKLVPCGLSAFNKDQVTHAQNFQEMYLKVILDRLEFVSEYVELGTLASGTSSSTFYLLLPVVRLNCENGMSVDWDIIRKCLSSPIFRGPSNVTEISALGQFQLANGSRSINDVRNSLVYASYQKKFYFVTKIVLEKNGHSPHKDSSSKSHVEYLAEMFGIHLKYPEQPLLRAKQLFCLRNLLHDRGLENSESHEKEEHFVDLVPELCALKITALSKDIGSSISLLPSFMHRLENLLVAIELKCMLSSSFPEGAEITSHRVLEALTTENCQERLSLERLETLGDSFLKFVVSRNLFLSYDNLDEGELTRRRSNSVNNDNLYKVAKKHNLQVYIRDQAFDPCQFFALGHPCPTVCTKETESSIHSHTKPLANGQAAVEVRCNKVHHWLHKKTIADMVEALIGAFLVDSGFKAATAFLRWIGIKVDFDASQVINVCQASSRYMPLSSLIDIAALEKSLGYHFLCRGLLLQAFVHPSFNKHGGGCYQRLEFLGDAVLDYVITSYIFSAYPKLKPGHLTDLRSALVNNRAFVNIAIDRSLQNFIICDSSSLSEAIENYVKFVRRTPASQKGFHEEPKCPKALGDLVESCMGAILLDTGINLNRIWTIVLSFLNPLATISSIQLNPKRELQELCEHHNWNLEFPFLKKGRTFWVEASVNGTNLSLFASASNPNKGEAIRIASEQMLARLKDLGYGSKSSYLEELLKSSRKMEARLIGFDETPVDVNADLSIDFGNLGIQEPSSAISADSEFGSITAINKTFPTYLESPSRNPPSLSNSIGEQPSEATTECDINAQAKGESHCGTARSRLFEICAANHWKQPVFECCHEEGPSHLKSFTYKAIIQIEDTEDTILECFGAPRMTKKAAADHAAEGALWYLEHEGY